MYAHAENNNIIGVAAPVFPGLLWCTCDVGTGHKYNIRIRGNVHTLQYTLHAICRIEEYVNTRIIIALKCKLHAIQIVCERDELVNL